MPLKGLEARPTTDFAKEGLFNVLGNIYDFEETEVLDLFSGTGSISLEFASRGSQHIDAVELNPRHASFIAKTAQELKFRQIRVLKTSVYQFLKSCAHTYDIIFADPPYDMEGVTELPGLILEKGILKEGGMLILEHSKKLDFSTHANLVNHRNYGSVNFSFFEPKKK
jgi:16S rRNA (guanine966-N2)-methyltransferase